MKLQGIVAAFTAQIPLAPIPPNGAAQVPDQESSSPTRYLSSNLSRPTRSARSALPTYRQYPRAHRSLLLARATIASSSELEGLEASARGQRFRSAPLSESLPRGKIRVGSYQRPHRRLWTFRPPRTMVSRRHSPGRAGQSRPPVSRCTGMNHRAEMVVPSCTAVAHARAGLCIGMEALFRKARRG